MLTSNTISNRKSYFDMQKCISKQPEIISYYPEGLRIVDFKWISKFVSAPIV